MRDDPANVATTTEGSARSFPSDRMACFLASRAELMAALPGWRVPLATAVERPMRNPFTGESILARTRDPGPEMPVSVPAYLPFEHVLLPNEEDWESRYLGLDLALKGEDGRAPDALEDFDALYTMMVARGLLDDALLGGGSLGDPRWVHLVPRRLVLRLQDLREDLLGATLEAWNGRSPSLSTLDDLRDLWSLARSAVSQDREMFLWLDAPPHRCSLHRPHRG